MNSLESSEIGKIPQIAIGSIATRGTNHGLTGTSSNMAGEMSSWVLVFLPRNIFLYIVMIGNGDKSFSSKVMDNG